MQAMNDSLRTCQLTVYRDNEELLVIGHGHLRMDNSEEVKVRMQALMESQASGRMYFHIFNMRDIDSAGLGVLVGLHMTARKRKLDFALVAPSADHMRILESTRLTSIMKIITGLEAETLRQHLERPELLGSEPACPQP